MKKESTTPSPAQTKTGENRTGLGKDAPTPTQDTAKALDFSNLDLTIDRVDERLSPSETNIFDK